MTGNVQSLRPRRKLSQAEGQIQAAFIDMMARHGGGCVAFSIPNEGARSKSFGGRMKAQGLRAGVADVLVLWRGGLLFIEFKAPTGKQTASQKAFEDAVTALGWPYVVCRGWDEAWRALAAHRAPLARVLNDRGALVMPRPDSDFVTEWGPPQTLRGKST